MNEPPATWRNSGTGETGHRAMVWPYLPEHGGEPLGFAARYEYPSGKAKDIIPFFKRTDDGQIRAGAAPEPRPLFGLNTLNRAGPVFVVEGEKDASALHYIGLAALTSPGGGRATDKAEWKPLQAALAAGRELVIWPDHDAPGRAYAAAVARLLGPGCACLVSPPKGTPSEPGAGAADWLAAALAGLGLQWDGLTQPDLDDDRRYALRQWLDEAVAAVRGAVPDDWTDQPERTNNAGHNGHQRPGLRGFDTEGRRYVTTDRGTFFISTDGEGAKERQLSNFTASIVEEVLRDDGQEQSRLLTIHGTREGRTLPALNLTIEQFDLMKWPVKHWGTGSLIAVGLSNRDHLKHAIQYLSHRGDQPVRERTVFAHTGWRRIEGAMVYLSAGTVIGAGGAVDGIEVDLGDLGHLYHLPPPSRTPTERREAAAASLEAATIAPPDVAVPLIAAVYLAPLAQTLKVDFALWLEGPSRSMKSTYAAIMAAHFGAGIERTALAASWLDTQNSIAHKLFLLADTLAVVDDYAPQPTAGDQAKLDKSVSAIVRAVGNRAGRGRLTSDIRLQRERPPRALTLCTAEQWPGGESINARLFGVSLTPNTLDIERLNRGQAAAKDGRLSRAMADHLALCAADFDRYTTQAGEDWQLWRERAMAAGLSGRTPEQAAFLLVGYGLAVTHWRTAGTISDAEAGDLFSHAQGVIFDLARTHERRINSAQPADAFVRILADLLLSGGAYLEDCHNGGRPLINDDRYGWKPDQSKGEHIGWVNEAKRQVYLLPTPTFEAVAKGARGMNTPLNLTPSALWRQLRERGVLRPGDIENRQGEPITRTTNKVRIRQRLQNVLVMPLSILDEHGPEAGDKEA